MEATGVIRPLDPLGIVVIAIELRRVLDINVKDRLEIFVENEMVILKNMLRHAYFVTV